MTESPAAFGPRDAVAADLPALERIYAHEAATGHATFDTASPGLQAFADRLEGPDELLVVGPVGAPIGYAHSGPFRPRAAYDATREVTVYLAPEAQGRGLGRALYAELLARLDARGTHRVLAVIALPNDGSVALHASFGFRQVGLLNEVGRKFGRWIDVAIFERRAP